MQHISGGKGGLVRTPPPTPKYIHQKQVLHPTLKIKPNFVYGSSIGNNSVAGTNSTCSSNSSTASGEPSPSNPNTLRSRMLKVHKLYMCT